MGKLTTFEILVDNLGGLVKVGETLRGQLLLELSADLEVNGEFLCQSGLMWPNIVLCVVSVFGAGVCLCVCVCVCVLCTTCVYAVLC